MKDTLVTLTEKQVKAINYARDTHSDDEIIRKCYDDRVSRTNNSWVGVCKPLNIIDVPLLVQALRDGWEQRSQANEPSLNVETPAGNIDIYLSTDPEYPGFYVDVAGKQVLLVDYSPEERHVVVRIWEDQEDPFIRHVVPFNGLSEAF